VLAGSALGLMEIESESQTQDGIARGDYESLVNLQAADGILLGCGDWAAKLSATIGSGI